MSCLRQVEVKLARMAAVHPPRGFSHEQRVLAVEQYWSLKANFRNGRSIALQFANSGAHVLINGRQAARVDEVAKDHSNTEAMVVDVSQSDDARRRVLPIAT